ncbi:MAG: helix-turn-helix domain-containing protein [Bacteroidia bacterium]
MRTLKITPEIQDLIDLTVNNAVNTVIKELKKLSLKEVPTNDEDFLSAEQTALFLKIKLSTLYSKVEKGELPHYRSGKRKLLFSKKELEAFVSSRKGKSNQEIADEAETYILNNKRFK